jgi:outer membrane protein OmpA-like peptidoglycan-associated protein
VKGKSISINSTDYDCVFPFITKDGKRLFFASNMPGGFGGFDLYYADAKGDSSWNTPVNLGKSINSELDEMYPYIDSDTLYFSSKGNKGFGGADIFKSAIVNNSFSDPKNVGKPYNSSKDDFSFIINNKERFGYLSSNREGAHGYDNIYEFNILELPDTIRGVALNKITENAIEGLLVKLYEVSDSGSQEIVNEFSTNDDGKVQLILKKHVEYVVTFFHPGFDAQTFKIPAEERADIVAKFGLLLFFPIPKKDEIIKIDNIYFDYNKASIKESSFPALDVIAEYLTKNSDIRVELSAHTDSRGSGSYNLKLSDKRAKSVVSHLINSGIAKNRLLGNGYGEKRLVNKCGNNVKCSDEEHQENRRVEMKVL